MWKRGSKLSDWLKTSKPMSYGAREWLSARLERRAVPFVPVQAFNLSNELRPDQVDRAADASGEANKTQT